MNGLIPFAQKHNIALCRSAENKYIHKLRKYLCVRKMIRGKYCTFAYGKHLTLEKAKLIAGKVGELYEETNDKTEIMKGLIPFAAIFDPPRLRPILPDPPRLRPILPVKSPRVFSAAEML